MATEPKHFLVTYNEVHNIIKRSARKVEEFKPDLIIAIVTPIFITLNSGFFPARVMRTFLKNPTTHGSVPIFAICLSLYEEVPGVTAEQIGSQVIRTQWLGPEILVGKRVLIVDEVDDSRTTLQYAISELQKDVEKAAQLLPEHEREGAKTQFAVFVVHNKLKPKLGSLPADVSYYVGEEVEDLWLDYPWEATDIEEHDRLALAQKEA
ncbi:PRTase-like protein [Lactifluus subvellereus]|nr:PRTase-like protein [Lactifluus subvellereus]